MPKTATSSPSVSDWLTSRSRISGGFSATLSTTSSKWSGRHLGNSSRTSRLLVAFIVKESLYAVLCLWANICVIRVLVAEYILNSVHLQCSSRARRNTIRSVETEVPVPVIADQTLVWSGRWELCPQNMDLFSGFHLFDCVLIASLKCTAQSVCQMS